MSRTTWNLKATTTALATLTLLTLACGSGGREVLEEEIEECVDDVESCQEQLGPCGTQSLEEIEAQGDVSDACREWLVSYLPEPFDTFTDRLVILDATEGDASISFVVHGVVGSVDAMDDVDLATANVTALDENGDVLEGALSLTVTPLLDAYGDAISMSIVTDASASMRSEDLDLVAALFTDLVTKLPVFYEAEVLVFSDDVTPKQAFTSDAILLEAALARDDTYEQGKTALFDAMGAAVMNLGTRTRPLRILVVATDGGENASETWTLETLADALVDENVFVVAVAAYFSEPDELRALVGDRGVFFYAHELAQLRTQVETWSASLAEASELIVGNLPSGTSALRLSVGDVHVLHTLSFPWP